MKKTFGWSSQSRAAWPSYSAVAPVDSAIAVGTIGLAAFTIIAFALEPVDKAQMVEPLEWASLYRLRIVEELAVTGRVLETDVAGPKGGSQQAGAADYERHLSGALAAFSVVAPQPAKQESDPASAIRVGIVDGSVIAIGRARGAPDGYVLPLMPALAPPERSAAIAWVCGDAPVPEGRTIPTPRPVTRMPAALLPSPCRKGATR